jgi:Prolyl oligopeptidase, N-terminal beta-propeller domain
VDRITRKKLNPASQVPTTRRDPDSGYILHGRRFDDPYAWLERLDDAETQAWIAAQETVTPLCCARCRDATGCGQPSLAQRAMRASRRRFAPGRTDASSSGRRTPTTTNSSSSCGAARARRSRRCSTPTRGRATRRWCSPRRRPTWERARARRRTQSAPPREPCAAAGLPSGPTVGQPGHRS